MLSQGFGEDTPITVKTRNNFGEIDINIGFEGKPFVAIGDGSEGPTEDDKILMEYEDKYDYSYQTGYNSIYIVNKTYRQTCLKRKNTAFSRFVSC